MFLYKYLEKSIYLARARTLIITSTSNIYNIYIKYKNIKLYIIDIIYTNKITIYCFL